MHTQRGYKLLSSAFSDEENLSDQVPLTLHRWYENVTPARAIMAYYYTQGPDSNPQVFVTVQSQF